MARKHTQTLNLWLYRKTLSIFENRLFTAFTCNTMNVQYKYSKVRFTAICNSQEEHVQDTGIKYMWASHDTVFQTA